MSKSRRFVLVVVLLAAAAIAASLGPLERTLGVSARIVYLHGAWVWAALLGFVAAAAAGLAYLVRRRPGWASTSVGLGRAATLLWITSLLLSLWAMQTSWNGLYLAEPRWRLGVQFALVAVLLQASISLTQKPALASLLNLAFLAALGLSLARAESVMHPPSPISNSNSSMIQAAFGLALGLTSLAAWHLGRLLRPEAWPR